MSAKNWTDVLRLRDEVVATDGSVGELQMSLSKAVYQTVPVPYAKVDYYADITQPTPRLVGFLARVARQLGVRGLESQACFHLDQGMGGGKSHALVGLWHMVHDSDAFFATDLGSAVEREAQAGGYKIDLSDVHPVVLTCDGFSPGKKDARFGPATDLYGRFLWLLFAGRDDQMERWQQYMDLGANKNSLQAAFAEVGRPVLVLIDELMDYVMALTDATTIGGMPGEKAFLNALTDAVDDQPNVALVLVMIRSDEDEAGYHPEATALRDYLTPRLQRNGETVSVTEPADFAQIIRRRLFFRADISEPARMTGREFESAAQGDGWAKSVYGKLGTGRGAATLTDRVEDTYPFHPDLFALVSREWTIVQAFQRVRSTVQIFARTALYWVREHQAGRWVPPLIGVGDLPLQTDVLESVLSSGVLAGNDRAIQGYRAVATTDIINSGGGGGTAYLLDQRLADDGVHAGQPHPAVRMATACFAYSLVDRAQGVRGATQAEMMAAIHAPNVPYTGAEETFNALVAPPNEGGLGALERTHSDGGKKAAQSRYYLSIKQTLKMYHSNAMGTISDDAALAEVWRQAKTLGVKGPFKHLIPLDKPAHPGARSAAVFEEHDAPANRLIVLDPRHWTLGNGRDLQTRADLAIAFGIEPGLVTNNAASMVVALVNTGRRKRAAAFAQNYLAWEHVVAQINPDDDEYETAVGDLNDARDRMEEEVRKAYQHYAYLLGQRHGVEVQYREIADGKTTLNGNQLWEALVADGRATVRGGLAADYLEQLILAGNYGRDLTLKEVFAQPYSNPTWPLMQEEDDLRQPVFNLATSDRWMLVNADDTEAIPGSAAQLQPNTMQQRLSPRPTEENSPDTDSEDPPVDPGPGGTTDIPKPPGGSNTTATTTATTTINTDPVYERTNITLDLTSLTDDEKRENIWKFVAALASLLDPAKATNTDLQMLGLKIEITAQSGDTADLIGKTASIPIMKHTVEEDDGL